MHGVSTSVLMITTNKISFSVIPSNQNNNINHSDLCEEESEILTFIIYNFIIEPLWFDSNKGRRDNARVASTGLNSTMARIEF